MPSAFLPKPAPVNTVAPLLNRRGSCRFALLTTPLELPRSICAAGEHFEEARALDGDSGRIARQLIGVAVAGGRIRYVAARFEQGYIRGAQVLADVADIGDIQAGDELGLLGDREQGIVTLDAAGRRNEARRLGISCVQRQRAAGSRLYR